MTISRQERLQKFVKEVEKQLIVSCQALPEEALFGSDIMAKMAISAARGGARGIRANTPVDVKAIRQAVETGRGRIEVLELGHRYGHLSPLAAVS